MNTSVSSNTKDVWDLILPHVDSLLDLWRLRRTCKLLQQKIKGPIVQEIQLSIIRRRMRELGLDVDELDKYLQKTKSVISGSFIVQCMLGVKWDSSDIDIFSEVSQHSIFKKRKHIDPKPIGFITGPIHKMEEFLWRHYLKQFGKEKVFMPKALGKVDNAYTSIVGYAYSRKFECFSKEYHQTSTEFSAETKLAEPVQNEKLAVPVQIKEPAQIEELAEPVQIEEPEKPVSEINIEEPIQNEKVDENEEEHSFKTCYLSDDCDDDSSFNSFEDTENPLILNFIGTRLDPIEYIMTTFDLSIVRNYYDGNKLVLKYPMHILTRIAKLLRFTDSMQYLHGMSEKLNKRILKYQSRGFHIKRHKTYDALEEMSKFRAYKYECSNQLSRNAKFRYKWPSNFDINSNSMKNLRMGADSMNRISINTKTHTYRILKYNRNDSVPVYMLVWVYKIDDPHKKNILEKPRNGLKSTIRYFWINENINPPVVVKYNYSEKEDEEPRRPMTLEMLKDLVDPDLFEREKRQKHKKECLAVPRIQ